MVNVTDIVNAEIDENEIRRAITTSEQDGDMWIPSGVTSTAGTGRSDQRRSSDDGVLTVEAAAARGGVGPGHLLRGQRRSVDNGGAELVEAIDGGALAVASAP